MPSKPTIVLVPGCRYPPSSYDPLAAQLSSLGLSSVTVTCPPPSSGSRSRAQEGADVRVREMPTSHSPQLSRPEETASVIAQAAEEFVVQKGKRVEYERGVIKVVQ